MTRTPVVVWHLFASSSRVQRKRAVLTIAAVAWGALALLLLLSFGEGLKQQLMRGRSGLGDNLAIVWPGETGRPWRGMAAGRPIRPRIDDVRLLRARLGEARGIVGELRSWQTSFTFEGRTVNGRLTGTWPLYGELRNHIPSAGGRFINQRDMTRRRRVIFFGDELAEQIFGSIDPVGRTVLVGQMPYTVIGVMRHKMQMGTYGGPDASNSVIPATTFRAQFGRDRLENIVLSPLDPARMDSLLAEMHRVLGGKYGFDPEDEDVFGVWDTIESSRLIANMMIGIEVFLGIIGALTLTIGGVGVANIMYAVVKERTREIGVLMALGARRGWIVGSILLEGLAFTLLGGLLGIAGALLLIALISQLPTEGNEALEFLGSPTISLPIGAAVTLLLALIGIAAGYFPARRAASVQPAETLRYE